MSQKAQGLSISTIIIAVIALVVLVVLVAIFTGRIGMFSQGISSLGDPKLTCTEQSGAITESNCQKYDVSILARDATEGFVCCKPKVQPSTK